MLSPAVVPYIKASVPVLREHGVEITSVFYKNMFKEQPDLLNIFNMGNQSQGLQQQSLAAAVFAYADNFENPASLMPIVSRIVHKHASLGITKHHYPIVGRHLLGAIKEVLGDAATPELINAWAEAYGVLANLLIAEEKKLYESTAQAGDLMRVKVVDVIEQTGSVKTFRFTLLDNQVIPSFRPGQYISVAVTLPNGQRQLRQYSLSDAPGKPYLSITVKKEEKNGVKPIGQVSNWLHENVMVDSILEVSHPYGDFIIDTLSAAPLVMLSAGVGITPMVSALNHVAFANPDKEIHLLYAIRSHTDFVHAQDVKNGQAAIPKLKVDVFVENADSTAKSGRMTLDSLAEESLVSGVFYLCGPRGFMQEQCQLLIELGVSPERIHREVFGPDLLDKLAA